MDEDGSNIYDCESDYKYYPDDSDEEDTEETVPLVTLLDSSETHHMETGDTSVNKLGLICLNTCHKILTRRVFFL